MFNTNYFCFSFWFLIIVLSRIIKGTIIFCHRLDNSCFHLLLSLFALSDCLRIHGYFITYPWIFHRVSTGISLRIHGYLTFLLCLRGLLVACGWFFSYNIFVITPSAPLHIVSFRSSPLKGDSSFELFCQRCLQSPSIEGGVGVGPYICSNLSTTSPSKRLTMRVA